MIDPSVETMMPLAKAARIVNPSNPPHVATIWRWASAGVSGVRLESVKLGGVRFTSREAVARFIRRLNEPGAVPEPPSAAAERANAELVSRGA